MNKYMEALNNISSIDLDMVLNELGYEKAEEISVYGMNDYPNLEMTGDIETLLELVEKATPKEPTIKIHDVHGNRYEDVYCPCCGRYLGIYNNEKEKYCYECGQALDGGVA